MRNFILLVATICLIVACGEKETQLHFPYVLYDTIQGKPVQDTIELSMIITYSNDSSYIQYNKYNNITKDTIFVKTVYKLDDRLEEYHKSE